MLLLCSGFTVTAGDEDEFITDDVNDDDGNKGCSVKIEAEDDNKLAEEAGTKNIGDEASTHFCKHSKTLVK